MTNTGRDAGFTAILLLQAGGAVALLCLVLFWKGKWDAARCTGLAIAAPALVLLLLARYQLGRSFAVTPQAKALVTHGLYSKIRNPMYVFSSLLIAGVAIAINLPLFLIALAVLIPIQIVRARQEAKALESKFGEQYRAYRAATWF